MFEYLLGELEMLAFISTSLSILATFFGGRFFLVILVFANVRIASAVNYKRVNTVIVIAFPMAPSLLSVLVCFLKRNEEKSLIGVDLLV